MSTNVDLSQLAIDRRRDAVSPVRMRRHVLTRYVLPALLLCGFLGVVAWASWDYVFPPRPVTVVPVLATRAEVRQEGTPLFKAAGWVEPRPTAIRVAALAPGVVETLKVVEDQFVKQGAEIAHLVKDDADLAHQRALADKKLRQAEVDEANAALTAAVTRHKQPVHLEAALREAEAALAKTQTSLKNLPFEQQRAAARLKVAEEDYKGKQAAKGVVSGIAIETARREVETAKALVDELKTRDASLKKEQSALSLRCDALRTQLRLLADEKKAKEAAAAQVKAAAARLEQATVAVAEAKLRLDRMIVKAPVTGRVYQLVGLPGARLTGGMTQPKGPDGSTVVTMYQPEKLQVRVDVRFEDLPKVQMHQAVRIDNPALPQPLTGKVLFISSIADIQKNTLEVKVGIETPTAVFKPDMLVDATFLAPKPPKKAGTPAEELRLYLPQRLVQQGDSGHFVWVADRRRGLARKVPVELGASTAAGLVEITKGLKVASRVIATGSDDLRDGSRIRITGEEPGVTLLGDGPANPGRAPLRRLHTGDKRP